MSASTRFDRRTRRFGLLVAALVAASAGLAAVLTSAGGGSKVATPDATQTTVCDFSGPTPTTIPHPTHIPRHEARDTQMYEELKRSPAYGGRFRDQSRHVMLTTGDICALEQIYVRYGDALRGVEFRQVEYSYAELSDLQIQIVRDVEAWTVAGAEIISIGVREVENRVFIGIENHDLLTATLLRLTYGERVRVEYDPGFVSGPAFEATETRESN